MKLRMRDRVEFIRRTTTQNAFGDNNSAANTSLGSFWCHLKHDSGGIGQEFQGQNQIKTDFTFFFRKKSVENILKGDIAQLETPNVQVKINSIVEIDLNTIQMTGTAVA